MVKSGEKFSRRSDTFDRITVETPAGTGVVCSNINAFCAKALRSLPPVLAVGKRNPKDFGKPPAINTGTIGNAKGQKFARLAAGLNFLPVLPRYIRNLFQHILHQRIF